MTTVRGQGQRGCSLRGQLPPASEEQELGGRSLEQDPAGTPPLPSGPPFREATALEQLLLCPLCKSLLGARGPVPPSGPRRRGMSAEPSAGPRRGRAAAVGGLAGSLPAVPAAIQVRLLNAPKSSLLIPQRKGAGAVTALFDQITSFANLFYLRDEPATQHRAASCSPLPGPDSLKKPG